MELTVDEIAESLTLGDHRNLDRQMVRGALGLLVVGSGLFRSSVKLGLGSPQVVHVVASAVAHGARLTAAAGSALGALTVARVADARLSDVAVDADAPGISPRSMRSVVNRRHVREALRIRRRAAGSVVRALSASRVYAEYLFLAQAIRYAIARDAVADLPESSVVLTDFDRHAYSRPWIWAANQRGLRTITMVHGSPNRNYVPVLAGSVLAWGQVQADWFAARSPEVRVEIVGRPEVREVELQPAPLRRVVICHSAEELSAAEAERLIDTVGELRDRGIETSVRLHPSVPADRVAGRWADVVRAAGCVVETRDSFIESLSAGDGVICVSSTAAVEAMVIGTPVAVVADAARELPADLEALRDENPVETLTIARPTHDVSRIVAATGDAAEARMAEAMQVMTSQ
ncbi:hypothetical protein [Microbacterium algeriense]|uniref:hypothetical protein n=2 Tax=Microbacterium TaxID=33882 RepID=UPI003D72BAF0